MLGDIEATLKQGRDEGHPAVSIATGDKAKLLLVDDSPDNLVALEALLGGPDRDIVSVNSGEEALKWLLQEDFSAILLDVKMHGLDGYETASLIRGRERTRDVPILFITCFSADESEILRGYTFGAVDYIVKPIVPQILRSKVQVFVDLTLKTRELKRKNEELERAQAELVRTQAAASLIKHAPDPLFVSDLQAHILHANNAAATLLGLEAGAEGADGEFLRFLGEDERATFSSVLREVATKGITRNIQLNLKKRGADSTVPMAMNAAAWHDKEGTIIGVIGILHDMSEYARVLCDLEQSRTDLQEKLTDLQRFEEAVVGRELKMIELETEIARLKADPRS